MFIQPQPNDANKLLSKQWVAYIFKMMYLKWLSEFVYFYTIFILEINVFIILKYLCFFLFAHLLYVMCMVTNTSSRRRNADHKLSLFLTSWTHLAHLIENLYHQRKHSREKHDTEGALRGRTEVPLQHGGAKWFKIHSFPIACLVPASWTLCIVHGCRRVVKASKPLTKP